jgi:RNA polymerase sigma-70 factor, ECF subfamily
MIWSLESEKETVQRAREGDPNAFQALYKIYGRYVYGRCLQLTRDPVVAEELSQDVFLQIWRKISGFRGQSKFKTWVYKVTTNTVLLHLRKNRQHPPPERCYASPNDDRALEERLSTHDWRPDDQLMFLQAMTLLPPVHRRILMLHDIEGYKHSEIARILDIPAGTSKSNLSRGRRQIRTLFSMPA